MHYVGSHGMCSDKLLKALERETKLLERSTRLLSYRRLNWRIETRQKIRQAFEGFVQQTRRNGYPFSLHVFDYDLSAEGIVQISATRIPTGAIVRSVSHDAEFGERVSKTPVMEEGGTLVASLSVSGHVAFVVYPRKSDRIKPVEEQLLLIHRLDPTDVTDRVLNRVILKYLLYMRSTSVLGMNDTLSTREWFALIWMKIGDVRYMHNLSRTVISMKNEWAKLLLAGVIGGLTTYFTTGGQ